MRMPTMRQPRSPSPLRHIVLSSAVSILCLAAVELVMPQHAGAADWIPSGPDPTPRTPEPPNSITQGEIPALPKMPDYFKRTFPLFLKAPQPAQIYDQGGIPAVIHKEEFDRNPFGTLGTYLTGEGDVNTADNAFFDTSLTSNGRSCATCHQIPSGMSISVRNIKARFQATRGNDPLFDPVDGADCPSKVGAQYSSGAQYGGLRGRGTGPRQNAHSLMLNKGLTRIFFPLPVGAEFTIKLLSDRPGCNIDPVYGLKQNIISVYRRPRISANLKFVTTSLADADPVAFARDPLTGVVFDADHKDPATGNFLTGNIMWEGRDPTLKLQALGATLAHGATIIVPNDDKLKEMVDFENRVFSAQIEDRYAGRLDVVGGVSGGPRNLSTAPFSIHPGSGPGGTVFDEFNNWSATSGSALQAARRQSIFRGQEIFTKRNFKIADVAGLNNIGAVGNGADNKGIVGTCTTCHNQAHNGNDAFPEAQHDIGIGGSAFGFGGPPPSFDLPIFELTCRNGATTVFPKNAAGEQYRTKVVTNDPGLAILTGRCSDIGRRTVPPIRALAAREPLFSDGSARSTSEVVDFYNKRFNMALTPQQRTDLVNYLNAL